MSATSTLSRKAFRGQVLGHIQSWLFIRGHDAGSMESEGDLRGLQNLIMPGTHLCDEAIYVL